MKNNQKGFIIPLVIAIIAILAIGGGIYVYNKNKEAAQIPASTTATTTTEVSANQQVTTTQTTPTQNSSAPVVDNSGLKTYTSTQYGFSFQYPASYQAQDPDSNLMKLPNKNNVIELYGSPDNILVTYATGSTLDESDAHSGTDKIYFDATSNQWVRLSENDMSETSSGPSTQKITTSTSVGGLAYFADDTGISTSYVVPLSHNSYVILGIADNSPEDGSVLSNIASTFKLNH